MGRTCDSAIMLAVLSRLHFCAGVKIVRGIPHSLHWAAVKGQVALGSVDKDPGPGTKITGKYQRTKGPVIKGPGPKGPGSKGPGPRARDQDTRTKGPGTGTKGPGLQVGCQQAAFRIQGPQDPKGL